VCKAQPSPPTSTNSGGANRSAVVAPTARTPYQPMTEKERLVHYLKNTVSPVAFVRSGAAAGIGQWRGKPEEWPQGARGYQFRYESAFAEHIVKETLEFGASSLTQEENRFRPSGEPGFGTRLGYGISSAFTARHTDGSRRFSFSKLFAFAGAAVISRQWQPHSTHGVNSAGVNFGTMWGAAVGFDVVKEFWPRRQ
jgi:hypothetical protein